MADCVNKGQIFSHHCIESYKAGDLELADCLDTVQQMLATCGAGVQSAVLIMPGQGIPKGEKI